MILTEAIKTTLLFRQVPMTAQQIAYFLFFNHMLQASSLQDMVREVEKEVFLNPGLFTISDELVSLSGWHTAERDLVQQVFSKVQQAIVLFRELGQSSDCCNNMVLALLLYKRLSDIERSQQLGAPIVPRLWKFDQVAATTMLSELPSRVYEVMDYIERTDDRLANIFLFCKEELSNLSETDHLLKLQEVMRLLASLQLAEVHVPTPLFQAIFSRLFWNNVKYTSKGLGAELV
ncbi:hypothetical protein [uncultured Pontibacter sp.]|uniref:hypothetical protein n=1 Tax=uncultured Pontibacter sp. TaxID=453356 RepID=UPI00261A8B4B|nr:hypothetical protein [uncultured Pontibacter sp.]